MHEKFIAQKTKIHEEPALLHAISQVGNIALTGAD